MNLFQGKCKDKCPEGTFQQSNKCRNCSIFIQDCQRCSNQGKICTECMRGMKLFEGKCIDKCPEGTFQ